jgi:hypothetical protein
MPGMGDNTLTAIFNSLDEAGVKALGCALGTLAQKLYESGHNLQPDLKTGHEVLLVCLGGWMGSGKSTLSSAMLASAAQDAEACRDRKLMTVPLEHDLGLSREVVVWESQWSAGRGQQNRVRDCWLTEPFRSNAFVREHAIPERLSPGIEILEHGEYAPWPMQALNIHISGLGPEKRSVEVRLISPSEQVLPHWKAFRQQAQDLAALAL